MQVDEWVSVKTAGGSPRTGKILAAETFNEGIMYLVALEEYPRGIWFLMKTIQRKVFLFSRYRLLQVNYRCLRTGTGLHSVAGV
ncbi:Dextransucrase DSRB [Tatumella ptyseos]|uniref:Dextransucrase DSRB n=2 Tax=Tatumella ptyseos TaxID=82987 RepID=A0A2X5R9T4_9GAMM|nr:Dextransucrase DSRB [Tatumella ptyseos]